MLLLALFALAPDAAVGHARSKIRPKSSCAVVRGWAKVPRTRAARELRRDCAKSRRSSIRKAAMPPVYMPFAAPTAIRVSQGWSEGTHGTGENVDYRRHGIDFPTTTGTDVLAPAAMTIVYAGEDSTGFGWNVRARVDGDICWRGAHLVGPPPVSNGQRVGRATRVGDVGSSGWSTNPHLHAQFESCQTGRTVAIPYTDIGAPRSGDVAISQNRPELAPANRIDVFVRGTDNALHHKAFEGDTWYPWDTLGGGLVGGPDTASWGAGRLDVFVRAGDNALHHRGFDGGQWYPWDTQGGNITSDPSAVSWGPGRIDVFARGAQGDLQHIAFDNGRWHGWTSLGGGIIGSPDAASWGPGRLDVFVRGTDDAVHHRAFDNGQWYPWDTIGGKITADPSAVSWGPGRIDVFVRATDNALHHKGFDSGRWHEWDYLGGQMIGGPDASSWGPGRLDVFVRGLDDGVHHRGFDYGLWHQWDTIGGGITADPAAVSWRR